MGGFLSTSTSGGSLVHSFSSIIESIEMVNGSGEVVTFVKGTDEFNAAAVSMGLFGVITKVVLRVPPYFMVKGYEKVADTHETFLASAETLQ